MSVNPPPNPNINTFNNEYWTTTTASLTQAEADLLYLKFPVAQGSEDLAAINVGGIATFDNNMVMNGVGNYLQFPDGTQQTTASNDSSLLSTDNTWTGNNDFNGTTTKISNTDGLTIYNPTIGTTGVSTNLKISTDNTPSYISLETGFGLNIGSAYSSNNIVIAADDDTTNQLDIFGGLSLVNTGSGNSVLLSSDLGNNKQLDINGSISLGNAVNTNTIQLLSDSYHTNRLVINGDAQTQGKLYIVASTGGNNATLSSSSINNNELIVNASLNISNTVNTNTVLLNADETTDNLLNVSGQIIVPSQTYPNTTDVDQLATIGFVNGILGGTNNWTGTNTFNTNTTGTTQSLGDNTTKLATTAFVQSAVGGSSILGSNNTWTGTNTFTATTTETKNIQIDATAVGTNLPYTITNASSNSTGGTLRIVSPYSTFGSKLVYAITGASSTSNALLISDTTLTTYNGIKFNSKDTNGNNYYFFPDYSTYLNNTTPPYYYFQTPQYYSGGNSSGFFFQVYTGTGYATKLTVNITGAYASAMTLTDSANALTFSDSSTQNSAFTDQFKSNISPILNSTSSSNLVINQQLQLTDGTITATFGPNGLSTNNPTGLSVGSLVNFNQNDLTNVATISNNNTDLNISSGGDNVNITAGGSINLSSPISITNDTTSIINFNTAGSNTAYISQVDTGDLSIYCNSPDLGITNNFGGVSITTGDYLTANIPENIQLTSSNANISLNAPSSAIIETTRLVSVIDGVNNDYINLDMKTSTDQVPTIELMKDNLVASIYKQNDLYITTDQGLQQTSDKKLVIKSNNDSINLWSPTNKIFIDKTFAGAGDGEIVCSAITGSLNGNASTATTATNATTATQASYIQVNNTSANLTHYLGFFDSNISGYKIPQATNGLTFNPNSNTLTTTSFVGSLTGSCSTTGLVYISSGTLAITGSASATNIAMPSIFNATYKNYRIVLAPTTQLSFLAYPTYSLTAFSGTGTLPTTASLYGNELTSASSSTISAVYTAGATIATTPLVFAVSQAINHQTIFEIENVGFTATQLGQVGLKCKSFYSNPGVSGYSDRHILSTNSAGTITGITIQQSSISAGNNMTIGWTIYGYK